jgi:hypothetical protein
MHRTQYLIHVQAYSLQTRAKSERWSKNAHYKQVKVQYQVQIVFDMAQFVGTRKL